MPSPFPGMNPYLEQRDVWRDFHGSFLGRLRAALNPLVLPRFVVTLEESLYIDPTDDDPELFGVADAAVRSEFDPPASGAVAVLPAPVTARIPRAPRKLRRLAVIDARNRTLVTVIELLSPSNKDRGPDRDQYARKRVEVILNGANLVEIDLLRGGQPLPMRGVPPHEYHVLVGRRAEWPSVGVWPVRLRDLLPSIPIPLTTGVPEPVIDLQAVLHTTYDEGGYEHYIYRGDPDPPLNATDAEWATAFTPQL
jgi:hypothetical protein